LAHVIRLLLLKAFQVMVLEPIEVQIAQDHEGISIVVRAARAWSLEAGASSPGEHGLNEVAAGEG
jgi:hypothetical protein